MAENHTTEEERKKLIAFEKARFEYCTTLYEREAERKETLERKSQFLLSLVTLFLGAVFLKLDFLNTVHELLLQENVPAPLRGSINISLVLLALSLLVAMLGVLGSMRLQSFKNEYPTDLVTSLFAPNSRYLKGDDEADFYQATAMSYSLALEFNSKINERKAAWVKVSWFGVLVAAFSLAAFLSLYAYVSINH